MAEADGSRLDTDLGGDQSFGGGYGFKGKHRGRGTHAASGVRIGDTTASRPAESPRSSTDGDRRTGDRGQYTDPRSGTESPGGRRSYDPDIPY